LTPPSGTDSSCQWAAWAVLANAHPRPVRSVRGLRSSAGVAWDGGGSIIVKALRGENPFGQDTGNPSGQFRRMPAGRPSCRWVILVLATRLRTHAPRIAGITTLLILFILVLAAVVAAWPPWDSRVFNDPVESQIQKEYQQYSNEANTHGFAVVALSVRRLDPSEFTASTVVSIRFIGSALTNRQGKSILGEAAAFGSTQKPDRLMAMVPFPSGSAQSLGPSGSPSL
jgi:hypothetical protein